RLSSVLRLLVVLVTYMKTQSTNQQEKNKLVLKDVFKKLKICCNMRKLLVQMIIQKVRMHYVVRCYLKSCRMALKKNIQLLEQQKRILLKEKFQMNRLSQKRSLEKFLEIKY